MFSEGPFQANRTSAKEQINKLNKLNDSIQKRQFMAIQKNKSVKEQLIKHRFGRVREQGNSMNEKISDGTLRILNRCGKQWINAATIQEGNRFVKKMLRGGTLSTRTVLRKGVF